MCQLQGQTYPERLTMSTTGTDLSRAKVPRRDGFVWFLLVKYYPYRLSIEGSCTVCNCVDFVICWQMFDLMMLCATGQHQIHDEDTSRSVGC